MGRAGKGMLLTLVFSVLYFAPLARAQSEGEFSIRGFIRAAAGLLPKQLPRVRLLNSTSSLIKEVWADSAGRFTIRDVHPGQYWVEVSAPGFRTARQQVALAGASPPSVMVQLESEGGTAKRPSGAILDVRIPIAAQEEMEKAEQDLRSEHPERARRRLEKAIKISDSYPAAHRLLGQLALDDGNLDLAEIHIRRARELDPDSADGMVLEGALHNRRNQPEQAAALLRQALLSLNSWRGNFELAQARFAMHDFAPALESAKRALEFRGSDFPEVHVLLGNILVNLKRYPEAAGEYATFLKLAPNSPSAEPARAVLKKMQAAGIKGIESLSH